MNQRQHEDHLRTARRDVAMGRSLGNILAKSVLLECDRLADDIIDNAAKHASAMAELRAELDNYRLRHGRCNGCGTCMQENQLASLAGGQR